MDYDNEWLDEVDTDVIDDYEEHQPSHYNISRPTEDSALANIRYIDIVHFHLIDFSTIEWRFIQMVKHVNIGLGLRFADHIVDQFVNPIIQRVICVRLGEDRPYVTSIMQSIYEKMNYRYRLGLDYFPFCTPYEEVIKHKKLLLTLSKRHNIKGYHND